MSCYSVLLLYAVHYDLPFDSSFRLVKKCQFLLYQLEMIYMDSKFKLQRNGGWSFYTSVPSCSQWKRCLHSLLLRHHQYRLLIDTNKYWILNIHWWIGVTPLNGSTDTASCQVKSYLHFWRTLILLAWCCQPGAASEYQLDVRPTAKTFSYILRLQQHRAKTAAWTSSSISTEPDFSQYAVINKLNAATARKFSASTIFSLKRRRLKRQW